MKKFKLTCFAIAIAICGMLSAIPAGAEGDGGGFDGGDYGADFGGDYGGEYDGGYDSGGYSGYGDYDQSNFDQNGYDQSDAFYQDDGFNQPEDSGLADDPDQGDNFDQTGAFGQSNDSYPSDSVDQSTGSQQNDGFAQEPLRNELATEPAASNASPESAGSAGIDQPSQDNDATQIDQITQDTGITQGDSSIQTVNIENTNTDQNQYSGHDHHGGGHHHHGGFDSGFGLGLGVGLGFGFGPWGPFSPFAPFGGFGYYGFGVPFSSFGFYSNRVGVGLYNNYVGFGPYRYFDPYYPLGGYPGVVAAAPVFSAPMVVTQSRAPAYVQQNDVSRPAPVQNKNYWHYCRNPEGYYPYVKQCAGEWIKVPPQPS